MNRSALICLMILMLLGSCSRQKTGNTVIKGRMQDAGCRMQDAGCRMQDAGCRMILLQELLLEGSANLDSVVPDAKGDFLFRLKPAETGLYMLRLPKLAPLVLELHPGDSVFVSGSFLSFPADVIITGSQASKDLQAFFKASAVNKSGFDSLENILITHQDDPDFAALTLKLDESLKPIWEKQRELEINYLNSHPVSLTSLLVLNHSLSLSPVLTFDLDSVYFLRLDSSLGKAFPGNQHAGFHHKRIIRARQLQQSKEGSG